MTNYRTLWQFRARLPNLGTRRILLSPVAYQMPHSDPLVH